MGNLVRIMTEGESRPILSALLCATCTVWLYPRLCTLQFPISLSRLPTNRPGKGRKV